MGQTLSAIVEVCLALRARRLARRVSRHYDRALAGLGLDSSQFNVLCVIGAQAPIQLTEVAAILDLDPSTLSRTLKSLKNRGLITIDGGRGRGGLQLELTLRGEDVMIEALSAWTQAQSALTAALGEAGMGRVLEALDQLDRAAPAL